MLKFVALALVLSAFAALKADHQSSQFEPQGTPGGICPTQICHNGN